MEINLENAGDFAWEYIKDSGIDFTNLSPNNVLLADEFLNRVYMEWRSGNIEDLVAYEIGSFLESEPIHHLMTVSVYPLCDIWFHLENGDLDMFKRES